MQTKGKSHDPVRSVRASKRMHAKANRREGIRHLCRLLESVGGKTERQRPGKEAAGDGVSAADENGTGAVRSEAGAGRAAEDLGRSWQTAVGTWSGLGFQLLELPEPSQPFILSLL